LARALVAQASGQRDTSLDGAVGLLDRLLTAAEQGERFGTVLQILVLLALAEEAQGNREVALAHLARAVERAEPEGYVRLFLDEGVRLRPLLEALSRREPSSPYLRRLLGESAERSARRALSGPLVDPLSGRELDVLRLLGSELSGPEIARELLVSLNTMRTHTKSIYSKLGVTSRRAAVRTAVDLDLLSPRPLD
jgi:LuxR family maltose regulon positive regulatory protein